MVQKIWSRTFLSKKLVNATGVFTIYYNRTAVQKYEMVILFMSFFCRKSHNVPETQIYLFVLCQKYRSLMTNIHIEKKI